MPGNAKGVSHADLAAAYEDRAESDLVAAATVPLGDPEGVELLADAQAAATLALSHRTAEQTAVLADALGDDSHLDGIKREVRDGLDALRGMLDERLP